MTGSYGEALDALYRCFAAHRRPTSFPACACCWEGRPVPGSPGVVLAPVPGGDRPLRTLDAEVLGRVAAKVPHTGGSPAVLLHYLPRLLELAAEDRLRHPDVELAFGRVALAGGPLAGWPEPERAALRGFFAAFWARRLAAGADDPNPDIDASLCALGLATGDVAPYLEGWLRFEHHHAASHLRAFLERNVGGALAKGRLFNAFWGTPPRQSPCVAVVVGWLRSPATGAAVAAAFDRARNDEEAEALYDAHHLLEGLGPR